jgi:hypothetical protein
MNPSTLINQDSGNFEYYTPVEIVELARTLMGTIDLDPASSINANKVIKAKSFYTEKDFPLMKDWIGNIFMNHPFSRINNKLFIKKLVSEFEKNNITQACCITYAATSEKWFEPLLKFPQCFIYGRTNYRLPNGNIKKGVTKGSVITYLGNDIENFIKIFSAIGACKL